MTDPLAIFRNPPIRLSMDDPTYTPDLGQNIEVWLDGYEQRKVLAYDCEAGTVERYKVHGFGDIVVEDDEPVREVVSGRVCVRWKRRS